jgi:hypothetical protein
MTRFFSLDSGAETDRPVEPEIGGLLPPARRDGVACDLYLPGHQMHYLHQGKAIRSPSRPVRNVVVEGTSVFLLFDGSRQLHWRHHDPDRLSRMLELVPGSRVAYPALHALRVGPYWFNCAAADTRWEECRRYRSQD